MGKDKVPKAAPAAPIDTKAEEKKPIAKGHKQRGAGTVITAKPAVVTNDGILLKAHERLPSVLLNEYCQREKRPRPRFVPNPPGRRMTVILEDTKNSKNDLSFSPVQSFETDTVARDYAALLALFHFQKTIPLERKLPEPYSTTWLEMLAASKGTPTATASAKPAASSTPAVAVKESKESSNPSKVVNIAKQAPEESNLKGKGGKTPVAVAAPSDPNTAQWLCDNCGIQNFATTAAGIIRTKCFKCQSPKSENSTVVAVASSDASNKKNKAPPKAVLDLRAQNQFASKAEVEKAKLEERTIRNRRMTYFDALKRANRPKAIHLMQKIRDQLEKMFGIEYKSSSKSRINGLDEYIEDIAEEGLIPISICSIPYLEQAQILKEVCEGLYDRSYSVKSIIDALKSAIFARSDEIVEDFVMRIDQVSEENDSSIAALSQEVFQALCGELLESSIKSKTQKATVSLPTAKTSSLNTSVKQTMLKEMELDQFASIVQQLELCGWKADPVTLTALESAVEQTKTCDGKERDCLLFLISQGLLIAPFVKDKLANMNFLVKLLHGDQYPEQDMSPFFEEKEALEAILDDRCIFEQYSVLGCTVYMVQINGIELSSSLDCSSNVSLQFILHNRMSYPHEAPFVVFKQSNPSNGLSDVRLPAFNLWLHEEALSCLGNMMVYDLFSKVNDLQDPNILQGFMENIRMKKDTIISFSNLLKLSLVSSSDIPVGKRVLEEIKDDENDMGEVDVEMSEAGTDAETSTTMSQKSLKKNVARLHPFWSKQNANQASNNATNRKAIEGDNKYQEMLGYRQQLPAWNSKEEFLSYLPSNQVIIVTGETGCGKTTQIPQFIHEQDRNLKLLICQPRRLAAVGVATRVAEEQNCTIGDRVGYMVKGDSKSSARSRIMFCTYGVLLRRLQDDPLLSGLDYVMFDEVHERGIDSDFCLALLMDALSKRKTLKLILMSATISTSHFQDYVARELKLTKTVPLLHIPGFTYPVEEIYKADYEEVVRQYSVIEESQVQDYEDDYGRKPSNTIGGNRKREIDYDLLLKLVFTLIKGPQHLPDNAAISQETKSMLKAADGCILIFLPGVPEINRFLEFFKSYWKPEASSKKINLISLHGNTPAAEQKKVFIPAPKGTIKVVAATNVAEASVTIPDVTVVIDTCRVKEMAYDPEIDAFGLIMKFAAKDSLRQRKGRAGRVQAGRCYRMITKGTFEKLPPQSVPEILRLPLESIVLQVWAMLSKAATNLPVACTQLLNRCPDAPSNNSILRAQQNLISLQAIDNNQLILSPLGWHLSRLPCIPRTGKLLIYGCLLNCVYPAVCTAAAMTCRSPFMTAPDMINKVNSCKDRYSGGGLMSDYNIVVQVMQDFQESSDQRRFCRDNGLQYERMLEIKQTMREFLDDLVDIGLVSSVKEGLDMENVNFNGNAKKLNLLAAVYCSGLYPQVAKIIRPPKRFIEVMGAAVEKDVEAKEMKFYIPKASNDGFNTASEEEEALKAMHRNTTADFDISTNDLQRVFIHPSSANFNNTSFKAANYILFGEKQVVSSFNVESKSNDTKIFLRDTSEVTAYSLLFFGGKLDFYPQDGMIAIDHWITFACSERIAILIQKIREEFEHLLQEKIEHPAQDISSHHLIAIVSELLESAAIENR